VAPAATVVQGQGSQLGAAGDAELGVDVAQVEVDGAGAEEQPGGNVPVGQPPLNQPDHLELLSGEVGGSGGRVPPVPGSDPGGAQLLSGELRPRRRTQVLERGEGGPQVRAGVDPPPIAAQEPAVGKLGAGPGRQPRRALVGGQCRAKVASASAPPASVASCRSAAASSAFRQFHRRRGACQETASATTTTATSAEGSLEVVAEYWTDHFTGG
jgi:hypothetical protein